MKAKENEAVPFYRRSAWYIRSLNISAKKEIDEEFPPNPSAILIMVEKNINQ
jgi:hypothetical protein